jgi:hypothetical protein
MNTVVTDIGINLIASLIYDVFNLSSFNQKAPNIEKEIDEYLHAKINEEFLAELEENNILDFLSFCHTKELLVTYVASVISGDVPVFSESNEYISKKFNEKDLIKSLTKKHEAYYKGKNINSNYTLSQLFIKVLNLITEFFISKMSSSERIQTYLINKGINRNYNRLFDLNSKILMIAEDFQNRDLVKINKDYSSLSKKYNSTIKEKYNKTLVYGWEECTLDKFYIPPHLAIEQSDMVIDDIQQVFYRTRYIDWRNVFLNRNFVYITGGAGFGKSLFLKNLIMNKDKLNIIDSEEHIVIYCDLKKLIKPDGAFYTMQEYIKNCVLQDTINSEFNDDFIDYHFRIGRCILLLDALDEVPQDKRNDLHKTVVAFCKNENHNNKICITSRERGFIPEENIELYNIEPLNAKQIDEYIEKMVTFNRINNSDKDKFMAQTDKLVSSGFLKSFLILSLLVLIFRGEKELPETKTELYYKCYDYIAVKRETDSAKIDGNIKYDWSKLKYLLRDNTFMVLSQLCFPNNKEIHKELIQKELGKSYERAFKDEIELENNIRNFLSFCGDRTELFIPGSDDSHYRFFHRSFFEYFYSRWIITHRDTVEEIYDSLIKFDEDSEILELTLAQIKKDNTEKYFKLMDYAFDLCGECSTDNKEFPHNFNILTLFIRSLEEDDYCMRKYADIIINNPEYYIKNKRIFYQDSIANIMDKYKTEVMNVKKYYLYAITGIINDYANVVTKPYTYNISSKQLLHHAKIRHYFYMILFTHNMFDENPTFESVLMYIIDKKNDANEWQRKRAKELLRTFQRIRNN